MNQIRFLLLFIAILYQFSKVNAQDSLYTRKVISTLTDVSFHGRGYVNHGEKKAANYLLKEFKQIGLLTMRENYFQTFSFPVNSFPSKMEVEIDGKKLVAGEDFIVDPASISLHGSFPLYRINQAPDYYAKENLQNNFLIIDTTGSNGSLTTEVIQLWKTNPFHSAGMLFINENKLTWSVSTTVNSYLSLHLLRNALPQHATTIKINIQNKYITNHQSQNIIGLIPGTTMPDSFLFVTAHYDHLGQMGNKTYFPGANDNASGVSMLLNLAKHFIKQENKPRYTMVFICFAGEEAGLLGSKYYTEHPIIPLEKIRFLLNLDLLGTGSDGLMVVNGSIFNEAFTTLDSINIKYNYLPTIGKRGTAHNSDHYYFSEKGVPAFFCYTLGGITAYHDIYDKAITLPLTKYSAVFNLLAAFLKTR